VEERTDLGGHQAPHGPQPEAYDAECAALARSLESVSGEYVPERVTIFTDAQAAIRRMASEEPGPGQQYAIQARKHIATLRRARPGITIEVRWCPAHEGIAGNEKADEWAKIAAEKPGTRGVEYPGSLPRSLANLKREISEKKWTEARSWARGRISKAKYRMPKSQKPDGAVAGSTKRLVSRYYQLKTGHARTEQYLHWAKVRPMPSAGGVCTPRKRETTCSRCVRSRQLQQKILRAEVQKETGKWMSRWKIRGPSHRQEVWAGDAGIPHLNRCGKAGATSGREGRRESGVRV